MPQTSTAPPPRMVALDVFRGFTIAGMILVNNPGSPEYVYHPLSHAEWHGWTFADLIFPFFLFIVGVAIPLSLAKRHVHREYRQIYQRTFRRTLILFALGIILTNFPDYTFSTLRIPGVLQRIAVCYCLAVLVVLWTRIRGQIATVLVLLSGYWLLMILIPVPGLGAGRLEKDGNLAAYVDTVLLHGHLFRETGDPEGILSTIPALATTLLGALTGQWLQTQYSEAQKVQGLLFGGLIGVLLGQLLNHWFPINKNLWTSSFVVFTAGVALLVLGVCYWLVDIRGIRRLVYPLVLFGANPLTVYVLATFVADLLDIFSVADANGVLSPLKTDFYDKLFAPWADPYAGSFFFAVAYTALWLIPLRWLYRHKIFVRL